MIKRAKSPKGEACLNEPWESNNPGWAPPMTIQEEWDLLIDELYNTTVKKFEENLESRFKEAVTLETPVPETCLLRSEEPCKVLPSPAKTRPSRIKRLLHRTMDKFSLTRVIKSGRYPFGYTDLQALVDSADSVQEFLDMQPPTFYIWPLSRTKIRRILAWLAHVDADTEWEEDDDDSSSSGSSTRTAVFPLRISPLSARSSSSLSQLSFNRGLSDDGSQQVEQGAERSSSESLSVLTINTVIHIPTLLKLQGKTSQHPDDHEAALSPHLMHPYPYQPRTGGHTSEQTEEKEAALSRGPLSSHPFDPANPFGQTEQAMSLRPPMSPPSRQGTGLSRIPRVPVSPLPRRPLPAISPTTSADTEAHAMPSRRSAIPVRARGQIATSLELSQGESSEWETESIRPVVESQSTPTFQHPLHAHGRGQNGLTTTTERSNPRADSAVSTHGLEPANGHEAPTVQQGYGPTLLISASADRHIMGTGAVWATRRHGWVEPHRSGTVFYPRIVEMNSPESDTETHNPSTKETSSTRGSGNEPRSPAASSTRSVPRVSDEAAPLRPTTAGNGHRKKSSTEDEGSMYQSPRTGVGAARVTRDVPRTETQHRSIRTPSREDPFRKFTGGRRAATAREDLSVAQEPPRSESSSSVHRATGIRILAGTPQQLQHTSSRSALPDVHDVEVGASSPVPGSSTHSAPKTRRMARTTQQPPRAESRNALAEFVGLEPAGSTLRTGISMDALRGNVNFDDIVTRHPEVEDTVIQTNVVRIAEPRSMRVMDGLRNVFSRNRGDRRETIFEIVNARNPARAVEDSASKSSRLSRAPRASPRDPATPSLGRRALSFPRLPRTSDSGSPAERIRPVGSGSFVPPISHPHYRGPVARGRMWSTEADVLDVDRVRTYLQALETHAIHEPGMSRREKLLQAYLSLQTSFSEFLSRDARAAEADTLAAQLRAECKLVKYSLFLNLEQIRQELGDLDGVGAATGEVVEKAKL